MDRHTAKFAAAMASFLIKYIVACAFGYAHRHWSNTRNVWLM